MTPNEALMDWVIKSYSNETARSDPELYLRSIGFAITPIMNGLSIIEKAAICCEHLMPATQDMTSTVIAEALQEAANRIRNLKV